MRPPKGDIQETVGLEASKSGTHERPSYTLPPSQANASPTTHAHFSANGHACTYAQHTPGSVPSKNGRTLTSGAAAASTAPPDPALSTLPAPAPAVADRATGDAPAVPLPPKALGRRGGAGAATCGGTAAATGVACKHTSENTTCQVDTCM